MWAVPKLGFSSPFGIEKNGKGRLGSSEGKGIGLERIFKLEKKLLEQNKHCSQGDQVPLLG